jgi:hypothetical protein
MQGSIYTSAPTIVNVCDGPDCQGCGNCPETPLTGPNVWTGRHIDFWRPDPETDNESQRSDRAYYSGNMRGLPLLDIADILGYTVNVDVPLSEIPDYSEHSPSIPESAITIDTPKQVSTQTAKSGIERVPMRETYTNPNRPHDCRCYRFGDRVFQRICDFGQSSYLPVDCGDCEGCNNWYRYQIAYRFDRGVAGRQLQTIIIIAGLDSAKTASTIATQIGKRDATPRHRSISIDTATETYRAVIVYADPISEHNAYLIRVAAKRRGYAATVEYHAVTGSEIAAYIPNQSNLDGVKPSQFAGWCKGINPNTPDYVYSDGEIVDTPRNLPRPTRESHICGDCDAIKGTYNAHVANYTNGKTRPTFKEWRDTLAVKNWTDPETVRLSRDAVIDIANALRGGALDAANDAYDRLVISGRYQGPKRLIVDLALQVGRDGQIDQDARQCLKMAWLALE